MVKVDIKSASIVILAGSFNPSIATKDWLHQQNVIKDPPVNFVNTPVFSAFETSAIRLIVDPSRFQLTARTPDEPTLDRCALIASTYVEKLPHTPYKALGFNYVFGVSDSPDEDAVGGLRNRLVSDLGWLAGRFSAFAVGTIVVGAKNGARVTVRFEPSLEEKKPLIVKANYHHQVTSAREIMALSGRFRENSLDAAELIRDIVTGGNVHARNIS